MELKQGTYLQGDKYRIERTLGQGGFGITYLAEHELAGRMVCIKEFFPKTFYNRNTNSCGVSLGSAGSAEIMEAYKKKFLKEAKTIARLKHPNIISIFDVFQENGTAYYVMEYIEGRSLSDVVRAEGALAESRAVDYIKVVASALGYIHDQGVLHLDIKPGNIMLRNSDNTPVLIDFGLSKQYDEEGNQTSSTPVGISHGFAPIEQYQSGGVSAFSPETDIYSLGATLYFLVTGKVPPQASIIVNEGLPTLSATLSVGVRTTIERAMEFRSRMRPHTIGEFIALLTKSDKFVEIVEDDTEIVLEDDIDVVSKATNTSSSETQLDNDANYMVECVDLGLSVNWATCNVGASSPEEFGEYFAWGEVAAKNEYTQENCRTIICKTSFWRGVQCENINFKCIAGDHSYDAATAILGAKWRMPKANEFIELIKKCTWELEFVNGIRGTKITGPNGNHIFLPGGGWKCGIATNSKGAGYYWGSMEGGGAVRLYFIGNHRYCDVDKRHYGLLIRPVRA